MLPQIKASESLRSVTEIALGNGRIAKANQRQILREWKKTANAGNHKKLSEGQAEMMLASIGIGTKKNG